MTVLPLRRLVLGAVSLVLMVPSVARAQDVLQEGIRRGTPPPPALVQLVQQDPTRFEFRRAWIQKAERIRANRAALEASQGPYLERPELEAALAAMTGTLAVPTIGALYSDQASALFTASTYASTLFGDGAPTSVGYTVRTFYEETSLGAFSVDGVVPDWPSLPQNAAYYRPDAATDPTFGRAGEFIRDALDATDPSVDFGQFDNDGPDGVPNSGDDDGVVDVVAFLYQDAPKSCGGPGIWPHRWVYEGWWSSAYVTGDASANGGFIRVSDYMIQSGVQCDGTSLMEIGTYAHELGHALGLPDLYDTDGGSEGIGEWGLMGSGNWNRQHSPAHMSAWSKDEMGWLSVTAITTSESGLVLPPVYDGSVLRYDIPGTPEYFLLEHRNATGSDAFVRGPGLALWHIDPPVISVNRNSNRVNADENRKGVDLEEADGLAHLDNEVNRSDAGDVFPGSAGSTAFDLTSSPTSHSNEGSESGFALSAIALSSGTLSMDVTISTVVVEGPDTLVVGEEVTGSMFAFEEDTVFLALNAGDTFDIQTVGGVTFGTVPFFQVYDPAGNWFAGPEVFRAPNEAEGDSARFVAGGVAVGTTGVYTIVLEAGGAGGGFALRTRHSAEGAVLSTDRFDFAVTPVPEGSAPASDTLWLWNEGIGSGSFTISGGASWLSFDRTSGSLPRGDLSESPAGGPRPGLGAGSEEGSDPWLAGRRRAGPQAEPAATYYHPPGATPIEVVVDPAGFGSGRGDYPQSAEIVVDVDDPWGGKHRMIWQMRVYHNLITIVPLQDTGGNPIFAPWGLTADHTSVPGGAGPQAIAAATRVFVGRGGGVDLVDVASGEASTTWETFDGYGGVAQAADGTFLAANVWSGGVEAFDVGDPTQGIELFNIGSALDVAVTPDGIIWGLASTSLWRYDPASGQATQMASSTGSGLNFGAMAYNPFDGRIYIASHQGPILSWTDSEGLVQYSDVSGIYGGGGIWGLEFGASGRLYVGSCCVGAIVIVETDGTVNEGPFFPGADINGIVLRDGELYITGFQEGQLFRWPLEDGPAVVDTRLALGDDVTGSLDSPGEEDWYEIDLSAGDTIDVGVFATDLGENGVYPSVRIYHADGSQLEFARLRRFMCDETTCGVLRARVIAGWPVPETGTYQLQVVGLGGTSGGYTLRTRPWGDMVAFEHDRWVRLSAPSGSTDPVVDTVYLYNTGPTSMTWSSGAGSGLTLTPSGGTLPAAAPGRAPVTFGGFGGAQELAIAGAGDPVMLFTEPAAAPPGSVAIEVALDPTGLDLNTRIEGFNFGFHARPGDGEDDWGGFTSMGVEVRIHDPAARVIARDLDTRVAGIGVHADGTLTYSGAGNLNVMDPTDGSRHVRVAGLAGWGGLVGLDVGPGGSVYVADTDNDVLHRIRPDGGQSVVLSPGTSVFDVDVAPDGTVFAAATEAVWRLDPDGTATALVDGPAFGFRSVAFNANDGMLYYADGAELHRLDLGSGATQPVLTIGSDVWIYQIEPGRSGRLYLRGFNWIYTTATDAQTIESTDVAPMNGTGLVLANGRLYGTGMPHQVEGLQSDWIFEIPVDDGPPALSTKPVVAWAEGVTARQGETVPVAVAIDMSGLGTAIGSFQARMTFDTAVVDFQGMTSEFSGTFTPNTDSTAAGVIRFAGINPDPGLNLDTTRVAIIDFLAKGAWGSETPLDLDVPELAQPDFTKITDQMDVFDGFVLVSPGTFTMAMRGDETVSKEESRPVALRAFLSELETTIGAFQGRISIDPAVILVDSVTAGDYDGSFDSNVAMQTDSGFVRFAIVNTDPPTADSIDLATVWVKAQPSTAGGDEATIAAIMEEISDPIQFANLLPFLVGNEALAVTVSVGIWGDPNKDKLITALDALVCLSHVVGKTLPQGFDASFCDVAPDSGTTFTGAVTALDALAILSHVVGKSLPAHFRVGRNR